MNIEISKTAKLPSKFGFFKIQVFKENLDNSFKEHLAIIKEPFQDKQIINVRIHSECITGDTLGSLKCDCGEQLQKSLEYIDKNSGIIIYLRQEGRNIGLLNKINAYSLQDQGLDTIQANHQLGFQADERTYEVADFILRYYKITKINLLTNNPEKLNALSNVDIVNRIPIIVKSNQYNKDYLNIKQACMGHILDDK